MTENSFIKTHKNYYRINNLGKVGLEYGKKIMWVYGYLKL